MSDKNVEIVIHPVDGFLRSDKNPGALVNVDNDALQAYKRKRKRDAAKQEEINTLRNEVTELKQLLYKLLSEKNK